MKTLKISFSILVLMSLFVLGAQAQSTAKVKCDRTSKCCAKKSAQQTAVKTASVDNKACTPGCCALCPPGCCEGKAKAASLVNDVKEASTMEKICDKICPPKCCKGGAKSEATSQKVALKTASTAKKACCKGGAKTCSKTATAVKAKL